MPTKERARKEREGKHKIQKSDVRNEMLACRLTPSEMVRFGARLAQTLRDLEVLEGRLDEAKSTNKAARSPLEMERDRVSEALRTEREYRDVEVQWERDLTDKIGRLVRLDTGEIVRERPLDEAELQIDLEPAE